VKPNFNFKMNLLVVSKFAVSCSEDSEHNLLNVLWESPAEILIVVFEDSSTQLVSEMLDLCNESYDSSWVHPKKPYCMGDGCYVILNRDYAQAEEMSEKCDDGDHYCGILDIQFTEDSPVWPLLVVNFPVTSTHIPEKVFSWMQDKQSLGIGMMAGVFGDTAPQLRGLCDVDVPGGRPIANFWLVDNQPMCYPAYIIPNFHHRARIAAQDEAGHIIAQDLPPYSLLHSG